jgi:Peptidase A4 family
LVGVDECCLGRYKDRGTWIPFARSLNDISIDSISLSYHAMKLSILLNAVLLAWCVSARPKRRSIMDGRATQLERTAGTVVLSDNWTGASRRAPPGWNITSVVATFAVPDLSVSGEKPDGTYKMSVWAGIDGRPESGTGPVLWQAGIQW